MGLGICGVPPDGRVGKQAGMRTGKGATGRLVEDQARAVKKIATRGEDVKLDYVGVMKCPGGGS